MGHHQPVLSELPFGQAILELEILQGAAQLDKAPRRYRHDELQPAGSLLGDAFDLGHIVQTERPTIRHQNHPLRVEALEHLVQHRLQGLGLSHIARMHGMHQRQALG